MEATDSKAKAYILAKEAAATDFGAAIQGLMAGHADALEKLQNEYAKKDMAFLMALALTGKGKRLDPAGVMIEKIAEGLRGRSLCEAEKNFLKQSKRITE